MGSCSLRVAEVINSKMARTSLILLPLLVVAAASNEDGANWEVHPETGCVQFKYCPPGCGAAPTTTTTTTTTTTPPAPDSILMVMGKGYQFYALDENKPLPSCLSGPRRPGTTYTKANGRLHSKEAFKSPIGINPDGKLFYCESVYYEKECYTYSANDDTWVKTGVLPISSRGQQGAASYFSPSVGLVISGGNIDGGRGDNVDKVYRTRDGVTFEELPDLPEPVDLGCLVIVDDDQMIRLGGRGGPHNQDLKKTWSFKFSTNQWTSLADVANGGNGVACQMVTREDGEKEIISVGEASDIVMIYNIASNTWRRGNPFPTKSHIAAAARYGNTLLIAGGYDHNNPSGIERYVDTVYEYNVADDSWKLLPHRLDKTPNDNTMTYLSAMVIPDICN